MKTKEIPKALEARYGRPRRMPRPLLDCLVKTILSQNTTDKLRDEAYSRLTERFASWEKMREARVSEITHAIRVSGLHEQKTEAIKALLEMASEHDYDLSFICKMGPAQAYALLRGIKGIGDKTAKVCLLFSCGMPFFPVDTHIARVTRRLGLADEKWTRERISRCLEELFESGDYYALHINLIELGRELCRPRGPKCGECPIRKACKYARTTDS
ncbi:MAG: endonuclease III domain-containing protein [candidate division WOR-3 bacterium]